MKYGIIKNDTIAEEDILTEQELRQRFSNVSIPKILTPSILEKLNVVELPFPNLEEYGIKESATDFIRTRVEKDVDGNWIRVPYLVALPSEVAEVRAKNKWSRIRFWRNTTLAQTDFYELASYTGADKEEWMAYRQALRDLPQQASDPFQLTMPIQPSS